MARGKPWTEEEIKVLREMAEQGLSAQEIYESGKLPDRTCEAIRKQLNLDFLVAAIRRAMVETIEPVWSQFFCSNNSRFFCSTNRASERCFVAVENYSQARRQSYNY
jgi:hypothetical protein